MAAGLANRMFQYSYYQYLLLNNVEVEVDNSYKATKWKMEDVDWNRIFPCANYSQASKWRIWLCGGGYDLFSKIRSHYLKFTSRVYYQKDFFSIPTDADLTRFNYFVGVFQNAEMVTSVQHIIAEKFRFSPFTDEKNRSLAAKMATENSVAIHIRKGKDYLERPDFQGTCSVEYYQKAVSLIQQRVSQPVFYVFTDNAKWVKENLVGFQYILVDWNPAVGWGNHYDMQLQSCCQHNIIANSTYSWWGAFLNDNPNKIVIGPRYWFNVKLKRYSSLQNKTLCEDWIAL